MSWNDLVASASDVVMSTFGADGVYHSTLQGDVETEISIDRDVEVVDETGHYARQAMATIRSGVIEKVHAGDWLEVGDEWWHVEQLNTDDGYLTQLVIRPKL